MAHGLTFKGIWKKMCRASGASQWGKRSKKLGHVDPFLATMTYFVDQGFKPAAGCKKKTTLPSNGDRCIGAACESLAEVKAIARSVQREEVRNNLVYKNKDEHAWPEFPLEKMKSVQLYVIKMEEKAEPTTPAEITTLVADMVAEVEIETTKNIGDAMLDVFEEALNDTTPVLPPSLATLTTAVPTEETNITTKSPPPSTPTLTTAELNITTKSPPPSTPALTTALNCRFFIVIILPKAMPCSTRIFFNAVQKTHNTPVCVLPAYTDKMITHTGFKCLKAKNFNTWQHTASKQGKKKSVRARLPYMLRTTIGEASAIDLQGLDLDRAFST